MKTKGRSKSNNIQDVRGPTGAYARPSGLTRAKAYSDTSKARSRKNLSDSKLAKEAGISNVGKIEDKKLNDLVDQVIKESTKTQRKK